MYLDDPLRAFNEDGIDLLLQYQEGQHFDLKWKPQGKDVGPCLVAFANSNPEGGVVLIGVSDDRKIKGLKEAYGPDYRNKIQEWGRFVSHVTPQYKFISVHNEQGQADEIALIYVPFAETYVATTSGGEVFIRIGDDKQQLLPEEISELRQTRGIDIPFGNSTSGYLVSQVDLHEGLLDHFIKSLSTQGSTANVEIDRFLLNLRLAIRDKDNATKLTKSGLLLLAQDPRLEIPGAYVRVLKYEGREVLSGARQNLVQDEVFEGPIPVVAQRVQDYVRTQMRQFRYLGPDNRFNTEPELPEAAWFEAVINALVHRSYSLVNDFILIRLFDDRFEIQSPGTYVAGIDPTRFPDGDVSRPRNQIIMEFMQRIQYVQMLHEGVKRMFTEMQQAGLPDPVFSPRGGTQVTVTLYNDIDRRRTAQFSEDLDVGLANIFRLEITRDSISIDGVQEPPESHELRSGLETALRRSGWALGSFTHNTVIDPNEPPILDVKGILSIHNAFTFQVRYFSGRHYLVIDYKAEVRNRANLSRISQIAPTILEHHLKKGFARVEGRWRPCYIREIKSNSRQAQIALTSDEISENETQLVSYEDVLPDLDSNQISDLLHSANLEIDLFAERKRLSQLTPQQRLMKVIAICRNLQLHVFPLAVRNYSVGLDNVPAPLTPPEFYPGHLLREPAISFSNQKQSQNTARGLTSLGAFEKPEADIPLVLIATPDKIEQMRKLVERLKRGSHSFRGFRQTFGTNLVVRNEYIAQFDEYLSICKDVSGTVSEGMSPLILIYTPEKPGLWSRSNYRSPYYQVKHLLLESGIPSQGVDEGTLEDPEWKDLNMALDIFAKAGYTPWVLDEGLPLADVFVGLSYSSIRLSSGLKRVAAYVCVFDQFGRWQYYQGSTQPVPFERRDEELANLVQLALGEHSRKAQLRRIHIHHDYRLKYETLKRISQAIQHIVSDPEISFVHINKNTSVRLFNSNPESRYLAERGAYVVVAGQRRFFLATTGKSELHPQFIGTPRVIEAGIFYVGRSEPRDMTVYAQHILSLTKLNWASTQAYSSEPITTLYAGKIARYMNIFLQFSGSFSIHPDLENTPWFL